jgi:hypothetical protein
MKNRWIFFSSMIGLSFVGMNCSSKCATTDCGNPIIPTFSFRLVNSAGRDIIGSPVKQYDSANVKIMARRSSNGAVESIKRTFYIIADTNYITGFLVSKDYAVYYLSLNNTITDSLIFGFNNRQTDCCDKSFFSLNKINTTDIAPPLALPQNSYAFVK